MTGAGVVAGEPDWRSHCEREVKASCDRGGEKCVNDNVANHRSHR